MLEGCLLKRFLGLVLTVVLIVAMLMPVEAFAASSKKNTSKSKIVYVMTVNTDGARVRSTAEGGETDNVLGSLKAGTKAFYLGKSGSWYLMCSENGVRGYVFKGFLDYYGAVSLSSIYQANGSTKVYKKASLNSGRSGSLKGGQYVVVYAVSGDWAYIHTISGLKGYVKVSSLRTIK